MKKLLFATLCSAMFFGACSNEDSPIAEGPQLADNQFLLKLNAGELNLVQSRATAQGSEAKFDNTQIYLYDNSNVKIGGGSFSNLFENVSEANVLVDLDEGHTQAEVNSIAVLSNMLGNKYPFNVDITATNNYLDLKSASLKVNSAVGSVSSTHDVLLPFAASETVTPNSAPTVTLERKVARIDFVNTSASDIVILPSGLASDYTPFLTANNGVPGTPPTAVFDHTSITVLGNSSMSMYVLPSNSSIEFTATVGSANAVLSLDEVEPNKKYIYTLKYTASESLSAKLEVSKDWSDGPSQEFPVNIPNQTIIDPIPASLTGLDISLSSADVADLSSLFVESNDFSVSFRQETVASPTRATGKVVATVVPKRYSLEAFDATILIQKRREGNTPLVVQTLSVSQSAFDFKEVSMDTYTFMDRDLGAPTAEAHGEFYMPGLGFIDQATSSNPDMDHFSGGARITPEVFNTTNLELSKFFKKTVDGVESVEDPCPAGWHTMNLDEAKAIFDYSTTTGSADGKQNGNYDFNDANANREIGLLSAKIKNENNKLIWTLSGKELVFILGHGHIAGATWGSNTDWSGWWINEVVNNKYVTAMYTPTHGSSNNIKRLQCRPNSFNNFGAGNRRALLIRCVKDRS